MRPLRALAVVLTAWLMVAAASPPASGQPREALGGWAIDLRGAFGALPTTAGWTPPLGTGSVVPGRGFGVEGGVHVLAGPGRHRRLSLGVSGVAVQGRSTSATTSVTVTSRLVGLVPHIGVNFGHRRGWSYVSAGGGAASVTSTVKGGTEDPATWGLVVHYGGGARWFVRERVAVSLDLRFWALTPRAATATRPSAAASTRVFVSAGVAVR